MGMGKAANPGFSLTCWPRNNKSSAATWPNHSHPGGARPYEELLHDTLPRDTLPHDSLPHEKLPRENLSRDRLLHESLPCEKSVA